MITQLTRSWWLLALRGMVAVLLGLAILFPLDINLAAMGLLFGAFALADGLLTLIVSRLDRYQFDDGWVLLLKGPASIAIGVLTLLWPGITAQALVALIAAWAILTGAFVAMAALDLRNVVEGARQSAWDNLIEREMMRVR
jgi:uncharacterized membrane protein HdeD (DUF308 family)